jgi:hypothetical protein
MRDRIEITQEKERVIGDKEVIIKKKMTMIRGHRTQE